MPCKEKGRTSVYLAECAPAWGSASTRGHRLAMEDASAAVPRFADVPVRMLGLDAAAAVRLPAHLFGVYDGHGGSEVANYCGGRIHVALREALMSAAARGSGKSGDDDLDIKARWEKVFGDCFQRVDDEVSGEASRLLADGANKELLQYKPVASEDVGSTAVVALVCSSHVIIANCGDSRVALCRGKKKPLVMSVDHKPNREDERARIEAAGGRVIYWKNCHRVLGVLAVSRSIGDRFAKPYVISKPEVIVIPREEDDECLILASDGMWDVMSSEQACGLARAQIILWHKRNDGADLDDECSGDEPNPAAQAAANYLVKLALKSGSKDNITVTVIDLKPRSRNIKAKGK